MESHTKNHPDLSSRDRDFLVYEMLGSLESLTAHLGQPAHMFSYPAGQYDDLTLQIAREIGIQRAVTTQPGMFHTSDNWLELTRARVHGGTSAAGLEYLLHG
jgi:peptidoglycan/xylan/chitin deacetylase (PgdA/CDA1 family)